MGVQHSKGRSLASIERNSSRRKYLPANGPSCNGHDSAATATIEDKAAQELPPFTDRQKELVVATWKVVQEDIAKVGVTMFMK
ncbi:hypothetical protein C0Q70_14111 [Pomacea canaliculata]|uniref:Globin family profile domain-containing protein n=2 Tax=Pomacea canaliculata TaxID=400727 RepID=A0A2T7NZ34_POMCA|nr:hypothetical protein C0Q70_14111 [Pomacea canaliculata]